MPGCTYKTFRTESLTLLSLLRLSPYQLLTTERDSGLHAGVVATTNVDEATKEVDFAIMVGGFPRKGGMERKDVMAKNVSIYKSQASSLEKNAKRDVKVRRMPQNPTLHCQAAASVGSTNIS